MYKLLLIILLFRFAQLKRTGKVDKYLQRKERKVLAKTRKDAPLRREGNV